jgi:hypothetical protein
VSDMGFMVEGRIYRRADCEHRGNWDRATINGLVLLMCGDCAYTKVLAEDLETGRLYWEDVPDEGDVRLGGSGGTDVAEAVLEVQGDEGEQRVQPERRKGGRSRKLVQVVRGDGEPSGSGAEEGQPSQAPAPHDYEVLYRLQAGEVDE